MMATFTVRGEKIRYSGNRRYIVVASRPDPVTGRSWNYKEGRYESVVYSLVKPMTIKRTDSYDTARKVAAKGYFTGGYCVVVDTTTGEEV
jgi:hypothetical protein